MFLQSTIFSRLLNLKTNTGNPQPRMELFFFFPGTAVVQSYAAPKVSEDIASTAERGATGAAG